MKTEYDYDALFQALADIRKNLNDKLSSLAKRIQRAQLDCLFSRARLLSGGADYVCDRSAEFDKMVNLLDEMSRRGR